MSGAAALLFVVPVVLLVAGAATVWLGVREARRPAAGATARPLRAAGVRPAGVVAVAARVVAGIGTIGFAVLALSVLWSEQQYGIVILPIAALVGAALWNGVLLSVAAIATAVARRPGPQPTRDRWRPGPVSERGPTPSSAAARAGPLTAWPGDGPDR